MKFKNVFINLMISVLLLLSCITTVSAQSQDLPNGMDDSNQYTVNYRAHSSNIGWGDFVASPNEAGTTGKALSVEAIEVQPDPENNVHLSVQPHVQDIGWSATRF